jgi:sulfhydrogenase subunit beta (sulfur reductase)
MMIKLSMDKINQLFSLIVRERELYLPVEKDDCREFEKWTKEKTVCLDKGNTVKSAKDLFFPQSENLVAFKTAGKKIEVLEKQNESMQFVVFGVRACDAASFEILDKVFLAKPVDTYYKMRRDHGTVVTLACGKPEETCFCSTFGIDAANPKGDVATWIVEDTLYWKSLTKKGDTLTEQVRSLMQEADREDDGRLLDYQQEMKERMQKLPFHNIDLKAFDTASMNEMFYSEKWKKLSEACIGCGTCTFLCPTCQCYDIRDYDTGHGVQRFRCWDSCMYSEFTKMAAENPRNTQVERFRQRFMHKLVYFPANNNGVYGCVGCGRCVLKCPISMNIVKVIKALGQKNEGE